MQNTTAKTKTEQNKLNFGASRRNIAVIATSGSIRSLGSIMGSFIPLYFVQIIGGNPLTLGLFTSAASLFQFATLSIGGYLADFYGRRKIVTLTTFYGAFFPLLYAVVSDWRIFGALTVFATLGTMANPA